MLASLIVSGTREFKGIDRVGNLGMRVGILCNIMDGQLEDVSLIMCSNYYDYYLLRSFSSSPFIPCSYSQS
jgi:hypothetical protein